MIEYNWTHTKMLEEIMDWQKYASTVNTLVATAAIVVSGLWGITKYQEEAKAERKAQEFEAAKPFLQRQLSLCIEASDAAAALASAQSPERIAVARDRFWELYLGSLHIVEDMGSDESVAARMVQFGNLAEDLPSEAKDVVLLDIDQRGLRIASLDIGKACRRLIEQNWKSIVPQLRGG